MTVPMDFYSSYAQGFARVAACTQPIVAVDPERNADAVIEQVRDLHDEGVLTDEEFETKKAELLARL